MKNKKVDKRFFKNKKAAEMAIGTIIVIILSLVVLAVIVYGFTTGWTGLWQRIQGVGGGESNVQSVIQGCQLACVTQSSYDYCTLKRNVIFGNETKDGSYSCYDLQTNESLGAGLESCVAITCKETLETTE